MEIETGAFFPFIKFVRGFNGARKISARSSRCASGSWGIWYEAVFSIARKLAQPILTNPLPDGVTVSRNSALFHSFYRENPTIHHDKPLEVCGTMWDTGRMASLRKYKRSPYWYLRYRDLETGRWCEEATKMRHDDPKETRDARRLAENNRSRRRRLLLITPANFALGFRNIWRATTSVRALITDDGCLGNDQRVAQSAQSSTPSPDSL